MGVGIYDESAHEVRLTSYGERVIRPKSKNLRQKKPSRGGCSSINSL